MLIRQPIELFVRPVLSGFLICVSLWVAGQTDQSYGISPTTPLENCSVDQWTGDNGLLSNNLTSVYQASSGFLWITTNNGLMRFDGGRLQIFDQAVVPFLSTEAFYRVYEDKHKTLWFASRGNGILKYANNKFEQHLPDNPLIPKSLRTMLIEDDGTIWAGSDYKGLIRIRDTMAIRIPHPLLDDVSILALGLGEDSTLYIGTNTKGLLALKNGTIAPINMGNGFNHSVNTVKAIKGNKLYVGTTYGLYTVENGTAKKIKFLQDVQINHIIEDHFGSVWIATERGLARINEEQGSEEFLRSGKSFAGAHITSLCLDREGSLWLSTGKSGLLRLKESPIRNYSEKDGLAVDRVNLVTEAPDGKFFIALDEGFVNIWHKGEISPLVINTASWAESVRDILVEENGTIWMASYNGVLKKTAKEEKLFTTRNGLSSNSVRRILRDSKGNLWFATRTGGVIQFRDDLVVKVYNRRSGLSSDYILAVEEDRQGRMLIGTHSGGLNVINSDGTVDIFHIRDNDDGVLIFNLEIDSAGNVWLATSNGLFHFDFKKETFARIRLTEVVKGESYFDWVEDNDGNVWIPTNIGILHVLKNDVLRFIAGEAESVPSKIYNDYDGMKNKECTGATRSLLSTRGEVWVPTIAGVCVVNPKQLSLNTIIPPVYITEVVTDDREIANPGGEVVVGPGNFRITMHFTSLSLRAPSKNKFRYMLDVVDKEWKETQGDERSVGYTNLSPGKYTFHVKASNNDGIWNEKGASLRIHVRPFFYQTAWFYFFLIAFIVLVIYLLYRWRVNAIEHKNEELVKVNSELDRFVYSASHDLRAPLASILGLVKLTRLDQNPEHRAQYLDMVEKSIYKLDGFIHDIINYSRNARTELQAIRINFEAMINEILETIKYQEKSGKIKKSIQVNGTGEFFSDIKRLDIVLYNLITNAIKYHNIEQENPFILIDVQYSDKKAVIKVIDNGKGIDADHLANIFKMFYRADEKSSGSGLGLFIAKETAEKLKGSLSVESTYGQGSTFTIEIPCLPHPASRKD